MATITTINAGDSISSSRSDINTNFANLNSDKIETSYLDTDTTMAANSDSKIPTQKAVKAYIDSGGSASASTTQAGPVEEATAAEIRAGTETGSSGARLFVSSAVLKEIFRFSGNGADGDVTISSGTTTLTRDMNYNTLTVNGTGILETAGYRIFVKGTLTVDSGSGAIIRNNGGNGSNATGASGGAGGTKAAAGSTYILSGSGATGANSPGGAGSNGTNNSSITLGIGMGSGGVSGDGGSTSSGGPVAGGTGLTPTGAISTTPVALPNNLQAAYNLFDLTNTTIARFTSSVGGAGGASGASNGGTGGGGGGGGSGGGLVWISAGSIVLTGSDCITAKGGAGGNGGNGSGVGAGGGGGGGGTGGVIILIYGTLTGSGYSVAGGAGGNGGSPGSNGTSGTSGLTGGSGKTYLIQVI